MPITTLLITCPMRGRWDETTALTLDDAMASVVFLDGPVVADGAVLWGERDMTQTGWTLWRRPQDGDAAPVVPRPVALESDVYEYGGGAWSAGPGVVAHTDGETGTLVVVDAGGRRDLTPISRDVRLGDLSVAVGAGAVLAVRERHRADGVEHDVVAVDLAGAGTVRVLASGADFYAAPRWCGHGWLTWVEWDHPHMPWDATRLVVARWDGADPGTPVQVAGGPEESVLHPVWACDDDGCALLACTDRDGTWQVGRWSPDAPGAGPVLVTGGGGDVARAPWGLAHQTFVPLPGGGVLTARVADGASTLEVVAPDGAVRPVAFGASSVARVAGDGTTVAALLGFPGRPACLVTWSASELADPRWSPQPVLVREAGRSPVPPDHVRAPVALHWDGPAGPVQGWYYPPAPVARAGPPPMVVTAHGGPTSVSEPVLRADRLLWTTRGFAVLDVNYSGSTGFGRVYRRRLEGRWGDLDVADCVAGARAAVERGLADPDAVVVRGASAGGYLALRAVTTSSVFSAALCTAAIGDLATMARDTHKFESYYLDTLLGPRTGSSPYASRSPFGHAAGATAPVLLLHGTRDAVVPPDQARRTADALRAAGTRVELVEVPDEAHGFRTAAGLRRAFEAELEFLADVLPGESRG